MHSLLCVITSGEVEVLISANLYHNGAGDMVTVEDYSQWRLSTAMKKIDVSVEPYSDMTIKAFHYKLPSFPAVICLAR